LGAPHSRGVVPNVNIETSRPTKLRKKLGPFLRMDPAFAEPLSLSKNGTVFR